MALYFILGLLAGGITTVAGLGGGMALTLGLALFVGPHAALAATSPALLLGNVHRVVLFFRHVRWKVAGLFALGTLPGAFLGAELVAGIDALYVQLLLLASALLAIARGVGWLKLTLPPNAIVPAAFVAGVVGSTTGAAGPLVAPILLCAGVEGMEFVATTGALAVAMHVGRAAGYISTGMLTWQTLQISAVLAVGIVLGNLLGKWVRPRIGEARASKLIYVVMALSVIVGVGGLLS